MNTNKILMQVRSRLKDTNYEDLRFADEELLDCFVTECIKHKARYINDSDCIAILENAIDSYAKTLASTTKLKNFKGSVYDEQHILTHYYRIKLKKGVAQWLL